MRMLMGAVVIRHFWPYLGASVLPVERFHVPWWSWLPVPSPTAYRALLWLGVAAGVGMILGVATRLATKVAFAVVLYLLLVDMTGFVHNRAFLVWLLFGLSLLPTGGAFSLGRALWQRVRPGAAAIGLTLPGDPIGPRRPTEPVGREGVPGEVADEGRCVGPVWPVFLLRVVVSGVYLSSGLTKLFNPDWSGGLVLWDRVVRYSHLIPFDGWVFDLLTNRDFYRVVAPSAIALEVLAAIGFWLGRTRLTAIWLAILFHLSIELTASVQTFSYSAIAALLLWVTPAARDRVLVARPRLHHLVRRLDWLQRFRVEPEVVGGGSGTTLVDRDGTARRGRDAELTALSRLPLLFPVVAPVLAVHRLRRARRRGETNGNGDNDLVEVVRGVRPRRRRFRRPRRSDDATVVVARVKGA